MERANITRHVDEDGEVLIYAKARMAMQGGRGIDCTVGVLEEEIVYAVKTTAEEKLRWYGDVGVELNF